MRSTNRPTPRSFWASPTLALALALASVIFGASIATAGGQVHEQMKIKVVTDGGDAEVVNIDNLAVGDTREITSESGKSVLVTRDESGLVIDIDGKLVEVDLPSHEGAHDQHGQHRVMVFEDGEEIHDGQRRVIVKRKSVHSDGQHMDIDIDVASAEDIDVAALLSDLDLDVEDIIVIKKHIEVHEDGTL